MQWRPPWKHTPGRSQLMIPGSATSSALASGSCATSSSLRVPMTRSACPSFSAARTLGLSDQPASPRLPARQWRCQRAALVDRLIKAIGAEDDIYVPLTVAAATRAGVLRTEALSLSRHDISRTDAQVVAMAEERSRICAVTIITGDPHDINLLVGLTRRTNIAVDVPG